MFISSELRDSRTDECYVKSLSSSKDGYVYMRPRRKCIVYIRIHQKKMNMMKPPRSNREDISHNEDSTRDLLNKRGYEEMSGKLTLLDFALKCFSSLDC